MAMDSFYFGLIEMLLSFGVVLGLLGWQYWSLREKSPKAGPPTKPPEDGPAEGGGNI